MLNFTLKCKYKEENTIDWNRKIVELEQRLATVEYELQQIKHSAQHQQRNAAPPAQQQGSTQQQFNPQLQSGQQQFDQQLQPEQQRLQQPPFDQQLQPGQQLSQQRHTYAPPYAAAPNQQPFNQNQSMPMNPAAQRHTADNSKPIHNQSAFGTGVHAQQAGSWGGITNNAAATIPNFAVPPKQDSNMESILVKYVLPIVFVIVLLIGILMLFIAGIAYGLITEPVRCLLGVLLAAVMYIVGIAQQRFKRPIWGKSLLGGAHGVFIITISIAHLSYELIGVVFAAVLYGIAFGLITFSAIRWRSQLLVTIAVISGYLCMFLIDFANVHAIPFIVIQLVFSISMMLLSTKLSFRIAYCFAYMLLHVSLLITYGVHEYFSYKFLLAALIIQHLVVFISFMRRKLIGTEHTVVQIIGILAIISWAAYLYNTPGGISWVYAAVTLLIAFSYAIALLFFERMSSQDIEDPQLLASINIRTQISTMITAIALLCFFTELIGASFLGLILLLIGTGLILYGLRDEHLILRWFGTCMAIVGATTIVFNVPDKLLSYEVLSWIIMLISIPILYRECKITFTDSKAQPNLLATILWIEAALIFIFMTIIANLMGDNINSASARPYLVSGSWLIYAIAAIIIGSARKLKKARLTGIILLLAIVIKVIFIDITFLNILSKSIMFTILGGVGIVVSFFLYNRTDDKKSE